MKLLEVKNMSHSFLERDIFAGSEFSIYSGECVGVVGENGVGKSTFLKVITGEIVPDIGRIFINPKVKIGYLDQYVQIDYNLSINDFLKSAFQDLFDLEEHIKILYNRYDKGDFEALEQATLCYAQLEERDYYTVQLRIDKVAYGLGLHAIGLERKISTISSGQRAKLILAKLLLDDADLLLLDEPTNFLDKEHVDWLASYIIDSNRAFMIVSHDTTFIEKVATSICSIENKCLCKYPGSYKDYLRKKEHLRKESLQKYNKQQEYIKKTEEYIRKNRAGVKCKNARGRRKHLERLKKLDTPETTIYKPSFRFNESVSVSQNTLEVSELAVGYTYPLLEELSFVIYNWQKIAIIGANGVGKTTLLKTLMGSIEALSGRYRFFRSVSIGYYDQSESWEDPKETPVQLVRASYPGLSKTEIMRELYRCGISSIHAHQSLALMSGGEQAKVKLCMLGLRRCNFLILDEPTNHLDVQAKDALKESLAGFGGSVILVSHEPDFYSSWIDKVIKV